MAPAIPAAERPKGGESPSATSASSASEEVVPSHFVACVECQIEELIEGLALRLPNLHWAIATPADVARIKDADDGAKLVKVFGQPTHTTVVQVEAPHALFQVVVPVSLHDPRATREIATTIANMMAGIEDGSIRPAAPEEVIEAPPEIEPAIAEIAKAPIASPEEAEQVKAPSESSLRDQEVQTGDDSKPRWVFGFSAFSLQGRTASKLWRGAGAELESRAILRGPFHLALRFRFTGFSNGSLAITRWRGAFGMGLTRRGQRVDLVGHVQGSIEPWLLTGVEHQFSTKPLFGGALWSAALWHVGSHRVARWSWLLGPYVEGSFSGEIDNGLRPLIVRREADSPIVAALGGLEWSIGVAFGIQGSR